MSIILNPPHVHMLACEGSRMRTIALVNQKGGCGKTTVALHLAAAFWQAGENVLVLDLDPQATSYAGEKVSPLLSRLGR
jgi:chromosome partitioning protein